ncbi:MAG: 30S ribosomal protein S17 [Pyrinomonadaceae bacterium]
MPRKKKDESAEEITDATEVTEATEEVAEEMEAKSVETESTEEKPKTAKKAKADDEEPSIINDVIDTVASVVETVVETVSEGVSTVVNAIAGSTDSTTKEIHSKRAEKIGVVASDKMTNTVTVRVDRVVKHPMYRKYVRRKKKFMAHDEMGAAIGDKVRIVETRPLSARKRWRVVEIIQKAER